MKRLALGIVLGLLYSTLAAAQTCTPVKLSKSWTNKDDGTGPYMTFVIDGSGYNQESTINFAGTYINASVNYRGYVDVLAGYGGCTQAWYLQTFEYYYFLYDLTTGGSYSTAKVGLGNGKYCGPVPACPFAADGETVPLGLTPGHSYHLWGYASEITSVGTTVWYGDYVTINVQ